MMSDTQLEQLLASQPEEYQEEILRINTQARPIALQIALFVPILAGLAGLFVSTRMLKLPDPQPAGSGEGSILG